MFWCAGFDEEEGQLLLDNAQGVVEIK